VLEFKTFPRPGRRVPTIDSWEAAKDIAAFANALGGVILIGADEDKKRGMLGRYSPLTDPEAKTARDAWGEAVETRCSPKPMVNLVNVPCGQGCVVAVNVWPFPGQAASSWADRARVIASSG
jgi:predicted HTH transcriptional regulator